MAFLFDYIFYRVTCFYLQISDDKSNYIMGSIVLTIFQVLNIITFMLLMSMYVKPLALFFDKSNMMQGKYFFMLLCTIILVLNSYKYSRINSYEALKQKWAIENVKKKKKRDLVVFVYVLISIIFLIVSIIFYK